MDRRDGVRDSHPAIRLEPRPWPALEVESAGRRASFWGVVLTLAAVVACEPGPTSPSPGQSASSSPTGKAWNLSITGPSFVEVGATARYVATVMYDDGSTRDVTDEAIWTTSGPSLRVTQGRVSALDLHAGSVFIQARSSGVSGSAQVTATPARTFGLTVTVVDADAPSSVVSRAVIEVTSGNGTSFPSVPAGNALRFYGVNGQVTLRVVQPFYHPHVQLVDVGQHQDVEVRLRPAGVPLELSGAYTLTIEAAPSCASLLGPVGMSRSYAAAVTQTRPGDLLVKLSGATFLASWDTLLGFVDPSGLSIDFVGYGLSAGDVGPALVEQLPDGRRYYVFGVATGQSNGSGMVGTLDGDIGFSAEGGCRAVDHRVSLSRR